MNQLIEKPSDIYASIKYQLNEGVKDRHHGFHTPVFSNINKNGHISLRVVVLRKFDPLLMKINFHSDIRSKKIKELKKNSKTAFLFYDNKIKTQLRLSTKTSVHYNNKITQQAWDITTVSSRKCYLAEKSPSSKIHKPSDGIPQHLIGINPTKEESQKGYKNFVVIVNQINTIEWLYLSAMGHRRLLIEIKGKQNNYQWLIP